MGATAAQGRHQEREAQRPGRSQRQSRASSGLQAWTPPHHVTRQLATSDQHHLCQGPYIYKLCQYTHSEQAKPGKGLRTVPTFPAYPRGYSS